MFLKYFKANPRHHIISPVNISGVSLTNKPPVLLFIATIPVLQLTKLSIIL